MFENEIPNVKDLFIDIIKWNGYGINGSTYIWEENWNVGDLFCWVMRETKEWEAVEDCLLSRFRIVMTLINFYFSDYMK